MKAMNLYYLVTMIPKRQAAYVTQPMKKNALSRKQAQQVLFVIEWQPSNGS